MRLAQGIFVLLSMKHGMWKIRSKVDSKGLALVCGRQHNLSPPTIEKSQTQKRPAPKKKRRTDENIKKTDDGSSLQRNGTVEERHDSDDEKLDEQSDDNEDMIGGECELMDVCIDQWSETRVSDYLISQHPPPPLVAITEMHVRLRASHKFFCTFANTAGQECSLWISDVILAQAYRQLYLEAKEKFVTAAQR